jgi:TctA family transporter
MEISMLDAAVQALLTIAEPHRLLMLATGVLMGLGLGIIPGIGGLVGIALLLPFTYSLDPYSAFALLLGMSAVIGTSDTIPAVMFGVPGSSSAQATVMDGNPMAKNGEAGRALSAAFTASLIGGLVGALLLAVSIPVIRPFVLMIASPELLAMSVFGISMVSVLSGNAPLRGLAIAGFGVLLSMIGADPQTGTLRWTMGQLYLWDGLPMVPVVLGLFAVPELAELAIKRSSIASENKYDARSGMMLGMKDALQNWWLVLRCGGIGAVIGAIPGIGASVVDWIAYGHALQTEKGAHETFGKGDVRGVIAPESANNSIQAGALIPTIAFGVPGSATMAILLGAFLIQGLVPGPDMLTVNLQITYSMVWSVAIANILGAGICFAFSGQLAKLAQVRFSIILPLVMCVVLIGAYQATRSWGDIVTLVIFSLVGFTMKRLRWARPPLILGFVLGALIERYMFISVGRYGLDWLSRPIVVVFLALSIFTIVRPFMQDVRRLGGLKAMIFEFDRPSFRGSDLFYFSFIALIGAMVFTSYAWRFDAKIAPLIVGWFSIAMFVASLFYQIFRRGGLQSELVPGKGTGRAHVDVNSDDDIDTATLFKRAAGFILWFLALVAAVAVFGMIPAIPIFTIAYMRIEGHERWPLVLSLVTGFTVFVWIVFDKVLVLPWPDTVVGSLFPMLRFIPSV